MPGLCVDGAAEAAACRLPPLDERGRAVSWRGRCWSALVPPLALIFLVLGTIFMAGLATPTEAGAMGAAGRCCWRMAQGPAETLAAAPGAGQHAQTHHLCDVHPDRLPRVPHRPSARQRRPVGGVCLTALPGGVIGFLLVVNLLIFVLGVFPRFLRDRVHSGAAAGAGGCTSWASIRCGSAC
jgi:hypothetical protein